MALTDWRQHHGSHFEGRRALVTGGAGFIGSHLTEALLDLGAAVTVLDDLSGGDLENLGSFRRSAGDRLRVFKGSILDDALLGEAIEGADWVFHQAALGSVPRSLEQPVRYHEVNLTGTLRVLEAARSVGTKRVMFAASSSAYGDTPTLPKVETMPVRAKSPYAATKAGGEALMQAWADGYGLDTACLRYFNIFGPRQNANSAYAAVIAAFAKALLAGQRPMIYGDGEQSRDFTFVDNAVHANLLAARHDGMLSGAVLNVACGQRITVNHLAELMAKQLGHPELSAEHLDERAGDVKHSLASLEAIHDTLDYAPVVSFEAGLEATNTWYAQSMSPAGHPA